MPEMRRTALDHEKQKGRTVCRLQKVSRGIHRSTGKKNQLKAPRRQASPKAKANRPANRKAVFRGIL
jgi:hypothetical protein